MLSLLLLLKLNMCVTYFERSPVELDCGGHTRAGTSVIPLETSEIVGYLQRETSTKFEMILLKFFKLFGSEVSRVQ